MKILILESDKNLRQLYSTVFENLGSNVVVSEAAETGEAIDHCDEQRFDAILCCYELGQNRTSREFLEYYVKRDLGIPLILISSVAIEEAELDWLFDTENAFHFLKPVDLDAIVEKVGSLVYNRKFSETTIDRNFVKVKSAYFIPYNRALTDIFLRLSSSKLVKIMSAGSTYTIDDIEKYLARGVRHFYVGRSEFNHYREKDMGMAFLQNIVEEGTEAEFDHWSRGHKALKYLIEEFGISGNTIRVASGITDSTVKQILDNKEQAAFFNIKYKHGKDYIYDHSYLVSIIGCGIMKHLKSATIKELENFCYLSLFHDMSHKRDDLAMINGISDKNFQELDFKRKKEYLDAVNASMQLIQKSNFLNKKIQNSAEEYYTILMSQNSGGYVVVEDLSLLTRVFIIAHDFVSMLYKCDFEATHSEVLIRELLTKYEKGEFLKVVHALISCHQNYSDNII